MLYHGIAYRGPVSFSHTQKGDSLMSVKRKDSKGRILRTGESQRPDGRYCYKYIDAKGKQQFVYSWKLEPTDRLPKGKRRPRPPRERKRNPERPVGRHRPYGRKYDRSGPVSKAYPAESPGQAQHCPGPGAPQENA